MAEEVSRAWCVDCYAEFDAPAPMDCPSCTGDELMCAARHPETGLQCIEPVGHDGNHRGMGRKRLQMFGPNLGAAPVPHPAATDVGEGGGGRG